MLVFLVKSHFDCSKQIFAKHPNWPQFWCMRTSNPLNRLMQTDLPYISYLSCTLGTHWVCNIGKCWPGHSAQGSWQTPDSQHRWNGRRWEVNRENYTYIYMQNNNLKKLNFNFKDFHTSLSTSQCFDHHMKNLADLHSILLFASTTWFNDMPLMMLYSGYLVYLDGISLSCFDFHEGMNDIIWAVG